MAKPKNKPKPKPKQQKGQAGKKVEDANKIEMAAVEAPPLEEKPSVEAPLTEEKPRDKTSKKILNVLSEVVEDFQDQEATEPEVLPLKPDSKEKNLNSLKAKYFLHKSKKELKEKLKWDKTDCSKSSIIKESLGMTKKKRCFPDEVEEVQKKDNVEEFMEDIFDEEIPDEEIYDEEEYDYEEFSDEEEYDSEEFSDEEDYDYEEEESVEEEDSAMDELEDNEETANKLIRACYDVFGTNNTAATLKAIAKLYGKRKAQQVAGVVAQVYATPLEESVRNYVFRPKVPKDPKLVFGKPLPKDFEENRPINGFQWIFDHFLKAAISKEKEKRYLEHTALPRRLTHPGCLPHYPFRPTISKPVKNSRRWRTKWPDIRQSILRSRTVKRKTKKPRDPEKEAQLQRFFDEMARPKRIPDPAPLPPPASSGRTYTLDEWEEHLAEISRPKRINRISPPPPHFNPKALLYEPTPRILELAKPRPLHPGFVKQYIEADDEETKMKRARAYKPTERILKLAQPRRVTERYKKVLVDPNADVWKVNPNALKYKATKRIKKLAKPKEYPEEEYFDPYKVKESALNYKPTTRMLELAKPKGNPKDFKHNCYGDMYPTGPHEPFKVKSSSLKYKMTKRMKELAKPKGDPRSFKHNCFRELYDAKVIPEA